MSVETISLGCRLNFAESETMAALAPPGEPWVIVNSCAVTAEAVRQTRQAIRRAKRDRPHARVLVTGCAVELEPGRFAGMAEVDRVVGNSNKLHPSSFVLSGGPKDRSRRADSPALASAPFDYALRAPLRTNGVGLSEIAPAGSPSRVRSFVGVQTGCDHRCTFCTIWQARGPSRSLPFEAIRDAIAREIDRGAQEIVLTGVDITDYQGGLGPLCERLLAAEPRLKRLRLSSLDSVELDDTLFDLIASEPRLMPHFHLSLQAGDDMILKRMKRRHSRADSVRTVERIRTARPDATIGADLIAGFPTETEAMADNSIRLIEDIGIVAAHIFPFSPRPNTPAARMPQLDRETVKARAARLRDAAAAGRTRWLQSLVGTETHVLIETGSKGHSDAFAPVSIPGSAKGQSGMARILGVAGDGLVGAWA